MQGIEQLRHAAVSQPHGVETIVETLAHLQGDPHSLKALAHEARNMGTALGPYCELLEEPGVLSPGFQHYARELKTVAAASRRLMEKLSLFESRQPDRMRPAEPAPGASDSSRRARPASSRSATARPAAALPVRLTGEDLTRVLVNLVKNSVEAMPAGGRMRLCLREDLSGPEAERRLELVVEDSGAGIPPALLNTIFEPGFTTRSAATAGHPEHRGVGLVVTRSIVESAGGEIRAANRELVGASFRIVLPVPECL